MYDRKVYCQLINRLERTRQFSLHSRVKNSHSRTHSGSKDGPGQAKKQKRFPESVEEDHQTAKSRIEEYFSFKDFLRTTCEE